jgi:hypothetical protein
MRSRILGLLALTGASGCVTVASPDAVCEGLRSPVASLEHALLAHPETPDPVGEAGTDVVIGYDAGCQR